LSADADRRGADLARKGRGVRRQQVFATEAGATLPELMARLGHATPAAALVYLHARTDRDAQLTHALAAAMTNADLTRFG